MQLSLTTDDGQPVMTLQCTRKEYGRLLRFVEGQPKDRAGRAQSLRSLGGTGRLLTVVDFVLEFGDNKAQQQAAALQRQAAVTLGAADLCIDIVSGKTFKFGPVVIASGRRRNKVYLQPDDH